VHPFSPPNLLHSTSAAFLSCLTSTYANAKGVAILVPSQRVSRPPPKDLESSNIQELTEDHSVFTDSIIQGAQDIVLKAAGQESSKKWKSSKGGEAAPKPKRPDEIGEGSMYI
jgi:hypothetical protein